MTTQRTVEIVGGLNIQDVANGGAVFDIKYDDTPSEQDVQEEDEMNRALQNYLKLECLYVEESYDGSQPFDAISRSMQNLLANGQIKKKIIREGYGSKPEHSSSVNIHYNAYVECEAVPFDSTYARKKPCSFKIGDCQVIEGLEMAVLSMKINEKSQFLILPELAYRAGSLGRIPPDTTVLFEVELCQIQQLGQEVEVEANDKSFQKVYLTCLALCVRGKKMFKLQDYLGAIKVYVTAVNKLEESLLEDYEEQLKHEELLVRLYTNLLVSCTAAQKPKRGCIYAQKIYEMAINETFKVSAKVYFNHAKCQRMLGGFGQAERRLLEAKQLEPNNKEIIQELKALREDKMKYRDHQKSMGKALLR